MDPMNELKAKTPVVRGARACTVCRAAKMKCVGAEDGQKQCQRCKRANAQCVFEKHRRGRKPGSKLSEASKMLRRLEKGLNSAKMKSHPSEPSSPYNTDEVRNPNQQDSYLTIRTSDPTFCPPSANFPANELSPTSLQTYPVPDGYPPSSNESRSMDIMDEDDDDDDPDRHEDAFFPAKLIKRENQRNSFFRTILNPEEVPAAASLNRSNSFTPPHQVVSTVSGLSDPITAGIITEKEAVTLFDAIFLRLNPFINLFDPALHTVSYVRSKCPFLFTTLIMAGCRFFQAERFKPCQKLANEFAVRAFAEAWKRVEVVQAFACLTYWKDPDDNRTWTFIGYACRMAVELGLNRHVANPLANETDFQKLERRNRERTYLVLFVHDRSLSMQTGRHWMLPEDDLVRNAKTWHDRGGSAIRPEDVIVAAFVTLRRIAAETTDIFNSSKGSVLNGNADINYDVVLSNCNARLTKWDEDWRVELERAGGEKFHFSFLTFFRLYVRLFLNSFGIQASMLPGSHQPPSLQAFSTCCTSALDSLRIISQEFTEMHVLHYGQETITVMTAYSAVFLLKLLRSPNTSDEFNSETMSEIHALITQTADAYQEASCSSNSPVSISAAYHSRFLRHLVHKDIFKARKSERERHVGVPIDPRLQASTTQNVVQSSPSQVYSHQVQRSREQRGFHFPASPHLPAHPHHSNPSDQYQLDSQPRNPIDHGSGQTTGVVHYSGSYFPSEPHHATELDAHYWKNMFLELGFGENADRHTLPTAVPTNIATPMPHYVENSHRQQLTHQPQHGHHQVLQPQGQLHHYQPMHLASYGN